MCGILAYYQKTNSSNLRREIFESMLDRLSRRGPDEKTTSIHNGVGLGHTRLSIIDLATGSQPLFNETKDVACILNGEIYNFQKLRQKLVANGHVFQTTSDTEVIVHLYEEVGDEVFTYLEGMFAIVIYDYRKRLLLIGRDPIGEKPLYYHDSKEIFICGSELKALMEYPHLSREIDDAALSSYLETMYVPAPLSIFRSVKKLEPGHQIRLDERGLQIRAFWRPAIAVDRKLDERAAIEGLRSLLSQSVQDKLIADVPLGVFLSGGIDSSTVVAFMARHSASPVKTYSVGFGDHTNELPHARKVADMYGTDHTELVVESRIADDVFDAAAYYDEPFADSSSIPTYAISREAGKHVKVVLTGDGGDELFAGYESYIGQKYLSSSRALSAIARRTDSFLSGRFGKTIFGNWYPFAQDGQARNRWVEQRRIYSATELSSLLKSRYQGKPVPYRGDDRMRIAADDPLSIAFEHDINWYLPDDLLKKVDMASMAHGLECRAPFLDPRLVEYALSIPPDIKLRHNMPKYLLRKAMESDLPKGIAWREKQGFGSPIDGWLRKELDPMVRGLTSADARINSLLEKSAVKSAIKGGLGPEADWRGPIRVWTLLMLELWMQNYHSS